MTTVLIPDLDAELRKFTPLRKDGTSVTIDQAPKPDSQPARMMSPKGIEVHPAANIFPMMGDSELRSLAEDIRQHGQQDWCVIYQGKLLDGRNRWKACELLGIEPETCERDDDPNFDPLAYVLSRNLHRRHLTTAQRAMIAVEVKRLLEPEAKERKKANLKKGKQNPVKANLPERGSGKQTLDQAGTLLNVSGRTVGKAEKILASGSPELIEEVKRGKVSIDKAHKSLDTKAKIQPQNAQRIGSGVLRANEAIDCLKRIPKDDPLRMRGYQIVLDYVTGIMKRETAIGSSGGNDD